jgi:hypothetical protein
LLARLAALKPTILARMHGSAWRGDCAKLLMALAILSVTVMINHSKANNDLAASTCYTPFNSPPR